MTETELRAILQAERSSALGGTLSTELGDERAKALDYYNGDMDKDMPRPGADRSGAVSTDVADVVEGLMPSLLEIFASGDEVVRFEPVGPEDEDAAQQETDYVNHVFMQKNAGFLTLHNFVKDALLQKAGVVKAWWEKTERRERERYVDLTDDEYALLVADPAIEIVEHEERPAAPMPMEQMPAPDGQAPAPAGTLHTVTIVTREEVGCCKVEGVPPEEFGLSRRARSLSTAPYAYHKRPVPVSDLIAAGYDRDQLDGIPAASDTETTEQQARQTRTFDDGPRNDTLNQAMREVEVTEHYIRIDYDGDGVAELRRVVTAGPQGVVLKRDGKPENEEIDRMPFAIMSPIIIPHRVIGRSVAELVMDIQRIKTALLRALLDNAYFANNQRMEVAEDCATEQTLDDLLTNRPGGIVRVKRAGGITPIAVQPIGNWVHPLIEYTDSVREWRTGVTRQGQGLDANALQNQTATAAAQAFTAAQARMKMIARVLAETGIRDLFLLIHELTRKHSDQQAVVRLRNKWVTVDPREWRTRNDMTVSVGLGTGSKDQMLAHLSSLLTFQMQALNGAGGLGGMITPRNVYATLKRMVENAGLKSIDPYAQDPANVPPAQPQPDPKMVEMQARMQLEQQKAQTQAEAERMRAEADITIAREKLAAEVTLKREQMQAEMQLKREQMILEADMARAQALLNAQSKPATVSAVQLGGEVG
ncbi:hypothetical protein Sp245p_03520 [Azospirillum baldaniorum]|nr:hypothetical protein Sp245p_03520 [Azospirillum baldaniorum]